MIFFGEMHWSYSKMIGGSNFWYDLGEAKPLRFPWVFPPNPRVFRGFLLYMVPFSIVSPGFFSILSFFSMDFPWNVPDFPSVFPGFSQGRTSLLGSWHRGTSGRTPDVGAATAGPRDCGQWGGLGGYPLATFNAGWWWLVAMNLAFSQKYIGNVIIIPIDLTNMFQSWWPNHQQVNGLAGKLKPESCAPYFPYGKLWFLVARFSRLNQSIENWKNGGWMVVEWLNKWFTMIYRLTTLVNILKAIEHGHL